MKIPWLRNGVTIRQRLILLNTLTIFFVLTLISIYSFQLVKVEDDLLTLEKVDDTFNAILELRRYEKNIMLNLGEENIELALQALDKIEGYLAELEPDMSTGESGEFFTTLSTSFVVYKEIFDNWYTEDSLANEDSRQNQSHQLRMQGQGLVESANSLAKENRVTISKRFKTILFWLTFLPAEIFVIGAILFFSQVKNILKRLNSLNLATKSLAQGEFKPIPTLSSPDEISHLIDNFNQMGYALEQKQEQLIQSKKMASIGTFSSGIAHEINNPLNNISLSTDTLLEELDSMDNEESREILEDIMEQTERASKIVRNLLDFSRAQSAEMQPLYIDFVLHKTIGLISNELQIHKIHLEKDIADLLPMVNGDLQQLQQVFLNLIINAEQAIGDQGSITVKARAIENEYICTTIQDSGPGIAQENLEQIFDPFFTTKEAGKGTGLGLSIVYGIVKKHGGYIEVASTMAEGTTFSVFLPIYHENRVQEMS